MWKSVFAGRRIAIFSIDLLELVFPHFSRNVTKPNIISQESIFFLIERNLKKEFTSVAIQPFSCVTVADSNLDNKAFYIWSGRSIHGGTSYSDCFE